MDCFWYRYIYPKNLLLFDNQKLIAPEISRGGNFSFDQKGEFYSTTKIYGYIKKETTKEKYEFWLGLLNSQLFWFFIQNTGYVLRGGYYTFKTNYVQPFPIPENIPTETEQKIKILVNEILEIKQNSPNNTTFTQEKDIDNIIYTLYDLDKKDISFIDNFNHL